MIQNLNKTEMETFKNTKLEVPYHSQYLEVEGKENSLKSCGMTCIYMILHYYKIEVPSLNDMVLEGIKNGGLGLSGWNHDYFVNLLLKLGLTSEKRESMKDSDIEIIRDNILNGFPVVISAERRLFDKRIFHQVLITGIREKENGDLDGFYYHDPASLQPEESKYCYVPLETFFLSWRRMAIFAKIKNL